MISWWQEKVYHHCLMAPDRGMHVDQRWVDLVPGLFSEIFVLREPGYNVAYWNLHARRVTTQNGEVSINGLPCFFFHFSGLDPEDIESLSRHQNRFRLRDVGEARIVFESYRDHLLRAGWRESKQWPYSHDYFDNGARIPDVARRLYWSLGDSAGRFGNPFSSQGGSFFHWLNEPVDNEKDPSRMVTRLWNEVYRRRPDLGAAFPDVLGVHREAFLKWVRDRGWRELGVDRCFLPEALSRVDRKAEGRVSETRSDGSARFGVNLLGYVRSEKGMGEAVRSDIRSL
jgi:hypothetical protein